VLGGRAPAAKGPNVHDQILERRGEGYSMLRFLVYLLFSQWKQTQNLLLNLRFVSPVIIVFTNLAPNFFICSLSLSFR
jgi:hypothetical protein